MIEKETALNEQESLALITKMIQKAKSHFHESGTSAILWGSVVAFAGLVSFAESYWNFYIGFDVWIIVLAAIIPQIIISIKERKRRIAVDHQQSLLSAVWTVYGISILALLLYINIVPNVSDNLFKAAGEELLINNLQTRTTKPFHSLIFSQSSLYLILYAMPTLVTGIGKKFMPMLLGGIGCYALFVISCYVPDTWDLLLNGIAGIINWLIPGLILRNRYLKHKAIDV